MSLVRILMIPNHSGRFLFSGGGQQIWTEIDWFRDDNMEDQPIENRKERLINFIKSKPYYVADRAYLVLVPDYAFTIGYRAP